MNTENNGVDQSNLQAHQDAMAADSTPALPETPAETKMRATSRGNTMVEVLAIVATLTAKWEKEEAPGDLRDQVLSVLGTLTADFTAIKDKPRDPATVAGRWYVGVVGPGQDAKEGSREMFKSASVPNERAAAFARFKIVVQAHTEGAAENRCRKGIKVDDVKVFHRGAVLSSPVA